MNEKEYIIGIQASNIKVFMEPFQNLYWHYIFLFNLTFLKHITYALPFYCQT